VLHLRESSRSHLKPHDIHQCDSCHCDGHSFGTEVVGPHFTEVDVLGAIEEKLCENLSTG
jgi:hypothetical protein